MTLSAALVGHEALYARSLGRATAGPGVDGGALRSRRDSSHGVV